MKVNPIIIHKAGVHWPDGKSVKGVPFFAQSQLDFGVGFKIYFQISHIV